MNLNISKPTPFPASWHSFGLGPYRPCDATYCRTSYESLPPLSESLLHGTLDWLTPLESDNDLRGMDHHHTDADLEQITTSAQQLNLSLPEAFLQLLSSPTLMERIPSCTDCYFHLSSKIVPCPGSEKGFIIRFLNDSQGCLMWYLYVTSQGEHCILVSHVWLDMLADEQFTEEEVIRSISVCAASFEEFMYRFWIENLIWYDIVWYKGQKPLTTEEKRYLSHYSQER